MDQLLLTLGDIPHHGPALLAWVLLRHTLKPNESSPVVRKIGNTALQLGVFKYLSTMLQGLGVSGNNVRQCSLSGFCSGGYSRVPTRRTFPAMRFYGCGLERGSAPQVVLL